MRKGLIAIVVLVVLGALAVLFWPREVERGTAVPAAGDAAMNAPAGPGTAPADQAGAPAPQVSRLATARGRGGGGLSPTLSAAEGDPAGRRAAAERDAQTGSSPSDGTEIPRRAERAMAASSSGASESSAGREPAESAGLQAPVFDVVRISPDGQAVIAGRAAPGQTVEILLDGELVGSAEADATGAFVAVAEASPSAEPRELVLRLAGIQSAGAATASGGPVTAGERVASLDPAAGGGRDSHLFSAPVIVLPSADVADAPVLISPKRDKLELVQPAAVEVDRMALDRISYEAGGDVTAAGRGPDASAVRAYVNGELIAEAPVGEDGAWEAVIPRQVAQNTDLLRFDEVSAGGEVLSRLEAPFSYETEGASQELEQRDIRIERGESLWRIAEQHYGEGLRYSVIYSANAGLIRDPDLIYPGQVLAVPTLVETE